MGSVETYLGQGRGGMLSGVDGSRGEEGVNQLNLSGKKAKGNRLLKCATLNAQSLRKKMVELQTLVEDRNPLIISVTESWGKDCISDGIFSLQGYTMYRDDRNVKEGGGAILYVSNKLEQRMCRPLSTQDFENSVWCWVNERGGRRFLVGSVYRSTSSSEEKDTLLLEKITKAVELARDNRVLIMGDFNVPKLTGNQET